jgi:hypothetical protein
MVVALVVCRYSCLLVFTLTVRVQVVMDTLLVLWTVKVICKTLPEALSYSVKAFTWTSADGIPPPLVLTSRQKERCGTYS